MSEDDDISVASSWTSEEGEGQSFPKNSLERRGRPKDRTRSKRKGGSQSEGRASSIDFIRKVPVSPFRRDNNDQHHDSMERQRLNHTIRARSKSSSHAIAVQALFSNSAHNKPEPSENKITRNSSEPFFDTQIPVNYVKNIARRFQSQDPVKDDENENVVLVSMIETGEPAPKGYEADNQISYIEVCAEPPMSISSIDSDSTRDLDSSRDLNSPEHKSHGHAQNTDLAGDNGSQKMCSSSSLQQNNGTDMCNSGSPNITPSHANSPSCPVAADSQEPATGQATKYHTTGVTQTQPEGTSWAYTAAGVNEPESRGYTSCDPGNMKVMSGSDSSDSLEKSTSSSRPGYVRGRHKSYLRDTMQFSFYTGEKSTSSGGNAHRLSSDDSVYLVSRDNGHPGSPIVSDASTSGCSSGSDDHPRGRWSDGSYACPSNFGSYASQSRSNGSCSTRGHVHTNGCYGQRQQRQRSVSPDKRQRNSSPGYDHRAIGYVEPVQPLSRSLPSLPVLSPLMSDLDGMGASPPPPVDPIPSSRHPKDPKVILRAAHLSNELVRLGQVLERLHPQELQQLLVQRLRQRDSKAIVALGIILPRTLFPTMDQVHCVRCHKNYDTRQNSACTLKHPAAYVVKTRQDSRGAWFYCKACDGQFILQGLFSYDEKINSYMAGFCFNGQHSTNPADVNFSGIVKTCEEKGCVECYV